jgi:cytochrome c-type biogenesis protein CcmH
MKTRLLIGLLLALISLPLAAEKAEPVEDPAIEERFKALTSELRCLKCQNQTIYDSKAGLADDLRRQIRDQIYEGKSDQQIVDYLVARYGDFVRYRPAMKGSTLFLWIGPFIFLIIGVVVLIVQLRKRRKLISDEPLSQEDHQRAEALIKSQGGDN